MTMRILMELFLPFAGTALGAGCVFFLRRPLHSLLLRALTGFAAGVMSAAAVWSLLLPAIEMQNGSGWRGVMPAVGGFWAGVLFLLALDRVVPHLHRFSSDAEGVAVSWSRAAMLTLAVTLHNVPEGMAVGVVLAGWLAGQGGFSGSVALAVGIAVQNFPEGAIVSMPLREEGLSVRRAFRFGVLSGAAEPVAALLTLCAAQFVLPALPFLLAFAAGTMVYVVVEELIPEASAGSHSNIGTLAFAGGFSVMIALDSILGAL